MCDEMGSPTVRGSGFMGFPGVEASAGNPVALCGAAAM